MKQTPDYRNAGDGAKPNTDKVERALVRPTPEGVAALFAGITGRDASPEEIARLSDRLASLNSD